MDFEKLLKNHYVRLALLALLAYFAYHYFVGVKEGLVNKRGGGIHAPTFSHTNWS